MQKFICLFPALVFAALLAMVNNGCSAKDKKAYYLERADRYFAAGQYDEAEIEYMNVLRNDRENFQAISRLADIYFEEGRLKKAAPFIFKGYELATNDLNLNLKLGVIYLASGKLKEARAEANFVLDRNPQDERAPFLLVESALTAKDAEETRARLQLLSQKSDSAALQAAMANMAIRARDFKAAEISLKRAQALNPKSSAVWSALGALYLVQTNLTQAESAFKSAADFAPARSQEKLLYAEFKIQNGDVAAGRQLLAEMVKKTPDYIPALIKLAKIDANEAKYDDCAALLNKALAREPDNFDALLLSGQLQLAQGKTAEATAGFERMVKDYPQAPRAHYQLAVAYLSANEAEPAVKSLSRAVALDADFTEAILLLAELQIRMANADPAIAALKPLIQQHPEIMPAQLLLAGAYRVKNQFNEALGIYRRLAAANPANFQIPLLIGETFLQQKNPVEARKAFTKSLELLPDNFTAVQQLVILDLAEKQYAVALQRVQPLLEKTPKLAAPVLLKAQIFLAQGDTKQAEAALLKVVELQPDVETAYLLLARLYVDSKQNQKALVELKLAAEKNPTDTAPLLITGMIHSEERDYKAARDAYEKALVISPKFSLALNNLAYLYSEQLDDLGRAYELSQKARSLLPGDPATADTLGWILYKRGQYSSALSLLQESAGKLPDEPEVQFHLGKTYYMLSEAGQATVAFQRALQSSRDFQGKDECKQCLAVLAVDVKTAGADARASLEKRVAGQPGDFIALLRLATIYQREGNSDKAVAAYESVLKADASNLMALINLAQLYAANPKTTQRAFELAKAAYKLAPDNVEVAKIYGRLAFETGDYKLSLNFCKKLRAMNPVICRCCLILPGRPMPWGACRMPRPRCARFCKTAVLFREPMKPSVFLI